jgi:hypothetical protein
MRFESTQYFTAHLDFIFFAIQEKMSLLLFVIICQKLDRDSILPIARASENSDTYYRRWIKVIYSRDNVLSLSVVANTLTNSGILTIHRLMTFVSLSR